MSTIVDISEEELTEFLGNGGLKPETLAKRKRYYDEVSQLQLPKFSVFSCLSKVFVCTSKPLPSLPSSF